MNTEPEIRMSPLCQTIERDGKTVEVLIYSGDSTEWILEVEDGFGNSTVWDEPFASDEAALAEVTRTLVEEGIDSLIGPSGETEHGGGWAPPD
ncbi:MAG: hypothetical protein AAGE01_07295 [Pseudomonadota bacterium]